MKEHIAIAQQNLSGFHSRKAGLKMEIGLGHYSQATRSFGEGTIVIPAMTHGCTI